MATPSSTPRGGAPALFRQGAALAFALTLGAGTEALAQEQTPLKWGVMVDVGAPDGIGASAVVRPLSWLRLHAGATTNTISMGVRGGVSLLPLSTFIAPSLNLDAGHYFAGNYNKLIERFGGSTADGTALIQDVGYNHASASLGLNIGPADRWSIFFNLGMSYWAIDVNDLEQALQDSANDPDITATPLQLRFTSPSLKLGFLYYF
ncbi:hypothetical protein P2318_29250 [Myxococcaceae bacterium GXIMD 01537]